MSRRSPSSERAASSRPSSAGSGRTRRGRPESRPEASRVRGLSGPWTIGLVVLFVGALLWRLAYLGRLGGSPFAGSLTEDARIYWNWAGYLLQSGPLGAEPFFFGPLYPYTLACLRLILGGSIQSVLIVQALGGALAVVLLSDAARRLTRPAVGFAFGVLLCFYEMSVFFEGLVLMEAMLFLLESALLWYVVRSGSGLHRVRQFLAVGALIGVLAVGRASHGLLVVPAAMLLVPWRESRPRAAVRALALLGSLLAMIAPVTIRNAVVAHEWIPLTYNGGYNLYVGNNPLATGGWMPVSGTTLQMSSTGRDGGTDLDGRAFLLARDGRRFGAMESSRHWTKLAASFVRDHPGHAIRLTLRKIAMMWSHHEYPQIENVDVYRQVAGPLGLPLVGSFAFVASLAIVGAWFAWPSGVAGRFLVGYLATITLGVAPFFVTDRFRHHLVPAAALLAAVAIERLWSAAVTRQAREALRLAPLLLLGIVVTHLPTPSLSAERRAWGIASDIGSRWLERGRPDLALSLLGEAVEGEAREAQRRKASSLTRDERAQLHYEYGAALLRLGRSSEALPWLERAVREVPEFPLFTQTLAEAHRMAGREATADSLNSRLASLPGGAGLAHASQAWEAAQRGDLDAAARLFEAALAENPQLHDAWGGLVRAQLQLNRIAAAESSLVRAKAAGLPSGSYWAHRAAIAAASGQPDVARDALGRVPAEDLARDPVLRGVVDATRGLLSRAPARN